MKKILLIIPFLIMGCANNYKMDYQTYLAASSQSIAEIDSLDLSGSTELEVGKRIKGELSESDPMIDIVGSASNYDLFKFLSPKSGQIVAERPSLHTSEITMTDPRLTGRRAAVTSPGRIQVGYSPT